MINQADFLLKEIPTYHPKSSRYIDWWREQKRRCIEGYWVGGKWMPPNLYFYVNFGTILLNKNAWSKVKSRGRPFLRDLEWEFFYIWAEARGFSGFSKDMEYTCHRKAEKPEKISEAELASLKKTYPHIFKNNNPELGEFKKYIPAREYLRKIHLTDMGFPLMQNESKDFMMMGSRGFGKSYSVGVGIVAHGYLFDEQNEYVPGAVIDESNSIEIVVGAGEAKYSSDLLSKARVGLENLDGSQETDGRYYPCPFYKTMKGSWGVDKEIEHRYRKKVGGTWVTQGTGSRIKHRTFKNNAYAANGTRPGILVMEEIGMFSNLMEARNASVECQMNGAFKFGTTMFLGTGGDMDSGTVDASKMFHDPETYNLLTFNDEWEHTGKVGYFVPAYMGLNQFKEEIIPHRLYGETDKDAALKYLEDHREKLRKGKTSKAIDDELQNRPLTPSEMFLTKRGNVFPIDELRQQLTRVQYSEIHHAIRGVGSLVFDNNAPSGVRWLPDFERKYQPLDDYPVDNKDNLEGALVIYEHPVYDKEGKIPQGTYIIGHDPVANDEDGGQSLSSIYVLKTKKSYATHGNDMIVAEYVGRPFQGRHVTNELLEKLAMYYGNNNRMIYYENVRGNVKEYFEKRKKLRLLAHQPETVMTKKVQTSANRIYGFPMSNKQMKLEGEQYIRDWLLEEVTAEDGSVIRNLDSIYSIGLLKELIGYNHDGNFDRVMAFMGCVIGREENYNQYKKELYSTKPKMRLEFLTKNRNLFRNV